MTISLVEKFEWQLETWGKDADVENIAESGHTTDTSSSYSPLQDISPEINLSENSHGNTFMKRLTNQESKFNEL